MTTKAKQKERFALMQYQDEVTGKIEIIWNSRNAVTPFFITSPDGNSSKHINWHADIYSPNHVPKVGDRIFVNATLENVRPSAIKYVETYWEHPDYPMKGNVAETKEEAIDFLCKEWVGNGLQTHVAIVTEEMRAEFAKKASLGGFEESLGGSDEYAIKTVKVTLAHENYRREFISKVGGNTTGFSVLEAAVDFIYDDMTKELEEDDEIVCFEMTNPEGDMMQFMDDDDQQQDWLKEFVIAAEIIGVTKEDE